jgi:hypothetical protein
LETSAIEDRCALRLSNEELVTPAQSFFDARQAKAECDSAQHHEKATETRTTGRCCRTSVRARRPEPGNPRNEISMESRRSRARGANEDAVQLKSPHCNEGMAMAQGKKRSASSRTGSWLVKMRISPPPKATDRSATSAPPRRPAATVERAERRDNPHAARADRLAHQRFGGVGKSIQRVRCNSVQVQQHRIGGQRHVARARPGAREPCVGGHQAQRAQQNVAIEREQVAQAGTVGQFLPANASLPCPDGCRRAFSTEPQWRGPAAVRRSRQSWCRGNAGHAPMQPHHQPKRHGHIDHVDERPEWPAPRARAAGPAANRESRSWPAPPGPTRCGCGSRPRVLRHSGSGAEHAIASEISGQRERQNHRANGHGRKSARAKCSRSSSWSCAP